MDTSYVAVGTVRSMITDSLICRTQEKLRTVRMASTPDLRTRMSEIGSVTSGLPWPPQPIDATQALNLSAGVSNSSVLRGRSFTRPFPHEHAAAVVRLMDTGYFRHPLGDRHNFDTIKC